MKDIIRDAWLGQAIRLIFNNKYLQYPEEEDSFQWPLPGTSEPEKEQHQSTAAANQGTQTSQGSSEEDVTLQEKQDDHIARRSVEDQTVHRLESRRTVADHSADVERILTRTSSYRFSAERLEEEREMQIQRTKSVPIAPTKTSDGNILVTWYTTDDPENPQNWSRGKKYFVLFQLAIYTCSVYASSSMYVAGSEGVMNEFGVGHAAASLGLAIFVVGYGVGPLLFAPLSEIARFGRNLAYIPTFFLFVILSIPTAVVGNYGGLLVLRFLQGFFGSPCLANGGATVGDMFGLLELPIYLSTWTGAAFWGPALGPAIAGFAVQAKGWRWALWEIVWFTGPIFVLFFIAFPETSSDNILRRRAARLRKRLNRTDLKAQSEIDQADLTFSKIFWDAIIKPIEIFIKDPAITYVNLYTSLIYGIYYSFFEVFPLVYPPYYGFNLGETGLTFLTIGIACLIGVAIFNVYQVKYLIPDIMKRGLRAPEHRLVPALFAAITAPAGYFMFGWTARSSIHWIVNMIGVVILVGSNFIIFQCIFVYIPLSYPQYTASLFAANDISRALFAAGAVMFSRPMFISLGIGKGVSLLASVLSVMGVGGMFFLWLYGAKLRARSTFAAK
ncbi:hypothetical protein, variant [Exophiala mesophila]|uniref:Major facilitator superfamily (MFS) profile domain-containing protein n=1 Tax=Exophiala mesophila TaxID=212818 RepID=A0A0D1ZFS8_EXOME|nr:uncharacterized protein PV10_04752 [Exophiala mesophila]XP_016225117.1 hypothetical protein, variant [Exophiala mesophila]KIV93542.1 hypothetical protein PV10_04752 [Exophiala mesophila]KIV93543.1 hypothetical protein, variant [Exophiala mesophila]